MYRLVEITGIGKTGLPNTPGVGGKSCFDRQRAKLREERNTKLKDTTAAEPPSEQTVRGVNRVAEVSRGHIKPVETSPANRKVGRSHTGEGPNGGPTEWWG